MLVTEMRNIFDQYSQPENRVTHALASALHEDGNLLRAFLADIANCSPPKGKDSIEVYEQTYPGEVEAAEEETATPIPAHGSHGSPVENIDRRCLGRSKRTNRSFP